MSTYFNAILIQTLYRIHVANNNIMNLVIVYCLHSNLGSFHRTSFDPKCNTFLYA